MLKFKQDNLVIKGLIGRDGGSGGCTLIGASCIFINTGAIMHSACKFIIIVKITIMGVATTSQKNRE